MFLTTRDEVVWIIESEEVADIPVGSNVTVDGVIAGIDRVRADWIGISDITT